MTEKLNASYDPDKKAHKESNTDRLKFIMEEPQLRALFRDFLRSNFCEENLSFYLDVQDFKKSFSTTSSAIAANPMGGRGGKTTPGQVAMEKHHEALIQKAFIIYNTYLAPSSQSELNIDHGLRNELSGYLSDVIQSLTGKTFQGRVELEQANAFNATQLQTMIRLYERIQTHVFRLMASDSVPKVRKVTHRFKLCCLTTWTVHQDSEVPRTEDQARRRRRRPSCGLPSDEHECVDTDGATRARCQ